MRAESERMTALRRTLPRAGRRFAWTVRPGDLVHATSTVFEVLAVDNDDPATPGSTYTTAAYVLDEVAGETVRRTVRWRPGQELRVFRG